jgi:ribonucleoside-diphosphate reductase beta chain
VSAIDRPARLLDPGQCLTLRPIVYPRFYEMYRDAIKNTWTVEELDFATDVGDCFAACIEGLFFFGAFAYVYFLRSRGLLHGLAAGTSWVFRDESAHMAFAFEVVDTVRREEPELFDDELTAAVFAMIDEAIACETAFAEDLLGGGVAGLSVENVRGYLEFCADQRLARRGLPRRYLGKNPLSFMGLQDVQEVTNFFERRVSAYQVGVVGEVVFDAAF